MAYNNSPFAFEDIRGAFERALSTPKGISIKCASRAEAMGRRSRFNHWRAVDRRNNLEIYPEDHPLYGRSIYDQLVLRIRPKGDPLENYLFMEKRSVENFIIEDIP